MSKMYNTLSQLKKMCEREAWLKMVEQARKKKKITEEEYQEIMKKQEDESEEII